MEIQKNIVLAPFSSFQVGGVADYFCRITSKEDFFEALQFAKEHTQPIFFLGGGSNILFSDKGYRGMVLQISNSEISQNDSGSIVAGAGVKNAELYNFAKERNRDFSPFLTIPGTLGGAIAGNAGVPSHEISDYLVSAEIYNIKKSKFETVSKQFFRFLYRHTIFHEKPELRDEILIWSGEFSFPENAKEEINDLAKKAVSMRREKQPWGKTGGSFFKNPKEGAAGYFLDQVGMKEEKIGGVFFSEKHANFMMNSGAATQADILALARKGAEEVMNKFSVQLVPEVRILDEFGKEVIL